MQYNEALQFLGSFANYEREKSTAYPEAFKLDRMRELAKELGNPQNAYDSVIIAGSKGKGSTAAFLSSILRMDNWRVGLYTSPHLSDVRERIQVNGMQISENKFVEGMMKIEKAAEAPFFRKNPPTYFEILTAVAFMHFKEMKVNVAVLEVGLGGLYDSTNIALAKVVGITPVSLEHTDKLGKTLSKICVQKCGVIKGRELVVSGLQQPEAISVIEASCQDREATLFRVGQEIKVAERSASQGSQSFDVRTPWGHFYDLETHLLGRHQLDNAACAIGLAKALEKKTRLTVSEGAVRQGIRDAIWSGRLEKVSEKPDILLDGAHTVDSLQRCFEALPRHFQYSDLIVVFAAAEDKDVEAMLKEVFKHTSCVVLTQFNNPRALPAKNAYSFVDKDSDNEIFVEPDLTDAMDKARSLAGINDLILVTGSLYLVGEARDLILRHSY